MSRPGIFVTETVLPSPVTTAPPSSAAGALVSELPSGPTTPTLVTSWFNFTRVFGGLNREFPATFSANQFFRAGGRELFVSRVVRSDAAAASASILGDGDDVGTVADEVYLTFTAKSVGTYGNSLRVVLTKNPANLYDLQVYQESGQANNVSDDVLLETYTNLNLDDHGNSEILNILEVQSQFIRASWGNNSTVVPTAPIPVIALSGGTDGTNSGDLTYSESLEYLSEIDRVFVLFSPGQVDDDVVGAMVEFAEASGSFVVLDTDSDLTPAQAVAYADGLAATSHAAVYYPHLWVPDPTSRSRDSIIKIPPSGPVAGLYLATDAAFGVFKAPAGLTTSVPGVVAVERSLTNEQLDSLNNDVRPVNAIRVIPGSGPVVMGARTLDQSKSTKYINIRRTMVYLAKEMESLTGFALFRNNDPNLWREISAVLDNFLRGFFVEGGLRGDSTSDAYYIKVDSENNSPTDVATGVVNIEIGVALQFPAEFIKIQLTQRTIA
jgi:hypothetical protein